MYVCTSATFHGSPTDLFRLRSIYSHFAFSFSPHLFLSFSLARFFSRIFFSLRFPYFVSTLSPPVSFHSNSSLLILLVSDLSGCRDAFYIGICGIDIGVIYNMHLKNGVDMCAKNERDISVNLTPLLKKKSNSNVIMNDNFYIVLICQCNLEFIAPTN